MGRRRINKIRFVVLGVFVAVFLFTFLVQKFKDSNEVDAANMAAFDPGYIISDYQMGNYNSMNESQIQSFLSSKGRCGNTNFSGVGTRVGHFSDSTPPTTWHVVNGHTVCLAEENMNGESAAHIIWQAAQDYRINPQVLIVLLQKETGLITDPIPNSWDYQRATGYGCPDTAACSSKYYGFKNQVRNAASLFRYTLDNGYSRYPIGSVYVQWNPNAGCGGSVVNIRNNATSALYRYTPYQPNAAALASSYGGGDGCSAFGNRNFYSYFEDWFGDIKDEGLKVPESSYIVEGDYVIKSRVGSNSALDVAGGSSANGANIQLFQNNGTAAQKWRITRNSDNTYTIKNAASGRVLDVAGGGTGNGANVQIFASNGTCAQKWSIVRNSDGTLTIYSTCSGRVLDVAGGSSANGANIQIFRPNGTMAQKWNFVASREINNGEYLITSGMTGGLAIDIEGGVGSAKNTTNIQLYESNNTSAQKWRLTYGSDGYYVVSNSATGKVLDVAGGGTSNGSNIHLYTANGTCAQKWQIVKDDSGNFVFYSACSGLALDVAGGSSANGANIQIFRPNGTMAQKWKLTLIRDAIDGDYNIRSAINNSKVIDVAGGGTSNGSNIQLYSSNNTEAQKWLIQSSADGYYVVKNPISGKVLDVAGGGTSNGSNIHLYTANGTCAQKWQIVKDDSGNFVFYSACSGLALDVAGGSSANGANIQLYSFNRTKAQKWQLTNY